MESRAPLRIEQAIDLILTIPAHRSSNDNHAKFGELIIQEYFIKMREEYKNDITAYLYLNNLFASMGSAIRAFSVQRDIFQTKWISVEQIKNSFIEKANRLDRYSPFAGNKGKMISVFISLGSSNLILKRYDNFLEGLGSYALLIPILFFISMFIVDFTLNNYRITVIKNSESILSSDLIELWSKENISKYKDILSIFIENAIEIHDYYYPEEQALKEDISIMTNEEFKNYIEQIIDKHMVY